MSSEAVAADAPPPEPPAEGGEEGGGGEDAPAPAPAEKEPEPEAEAPEPAPAPDEAPPEPEPAPAAAEVEAKEAEAEAPAEAAAAEAPPAEDQQQQQEEEGAAVALSASTHAAEAAAPAEAAAEAAKEVEEAAAALAAPSDEDGPRIATTDVVKDLLILTLKEVEGTLKSVTIESEAKEEPAAKAEEQEPQDKESGRVPSQGEGIDKPAPVTSELKKDSLIAKDRKSKFSMGRVPKSSFRFRTLSGSGVITRSAAEKGPRYENSYWLTSKSPFNVDKVNAVLRDLVDERVAKVSEKLKLQELSSSIVRLALAKIKQMAFDRYRIACVCLVGEKIDQGLRCSLRMLWDAEQDNYAWYAVEQTKFFVVASVFGIYYD